MKLVKNPAKRITRIYIIALLLVGLITVLTQFLISYVLENQYADSRVINIAGRQRMLSQKLTKIALIAYQADNETDFAKQRRELEDIVRLWEKSHKALQSGDTSLQIPANDNSEIIKKMFVLIELHFGTIKSAAEQLATYNFQTPKNQLKLNLDEIIENEPHFLRIMNEITFQYEKEAIAKIENLKTIEIILMCITLTVLFLEAILVFRPAVKKINLYFEQVQTSNVELQQANNQLSASQKELRSNIEELETAEEEIRQNAEELSAINDNLIYQQKVIKTQNELIIQRNKNITDSIKAAKRIQDGILIDQTTIISQFKDAFILNKPKDIVSGDFYWFSEKQGKKIIALGDCTGHGVSGALMTMVGVSILNEVVNENGTYEPHEILQSMDNKLRKILQPNANGAISDGMDLSILLIENQKLYFAAASNRMYVCGNNEITDIKGSSSPLGAFSFYTKKEYLTHEIAILPNHNYYIFSDGFKDQFGEGEERRYGPKNFKDLLLSVARLPMLAQREKIEESWLAWKGNALQIDDVMVIGLQLL